MEQSFNRQDYFSLNQAAKYCECTRQAIFDRIKKGRLQSIKMDKQIYIKKELIKEFDKHRFDRKFSKVNGELLFDPEKGKFSADLAAKYLGVSRQHIYYSIRQGWLQRIKMGGAIVISWEALEAYRKRYIRRDYKIRPACGQ